MAKHKNLVEFYTNYQPDFFQVAPKIFDNDEDGHAKLSVIDMYGSLFFVGHEDEKPIVYIRHANVDNCRFGCFLDLGDTYNSPQKGGFHFAEIAQRGNPINPYSKVSNNPLEYKISSDNPYLEYRYYKNRITCEEGNFFKAEMIPLPICIVDHGAIFKPLNQVSQPCIIKGTFDGKSIIGIGSFDKLYMPEFEKKEFSDTLAYMCALGVGLREDGKYEVIMTSISEDNSSYGFYWLEGNDPITSYNVSIETEFEHVPYINDGTCMYKDAVFKFADVELHFEGKWGTKGFTEKPRIEKHGQSQTWGTWYVGKTPYKHKIYSSFFENMECYDYKLKERNYKIKD